MDFEDEEMFSEDDFMSRSFDVFEDMRRNEKLVDFKITFENHSVIGHRLVLAARIPYFHEIFCAPQEEIILNEVDPDTLESVINFAYSGKIKITPGNVVPLIKTSKVLQLLRVYDACWEYLQKKLHSKNLLEFRRLAEDHGCTKFLEAADNYMRQNFEEFSSSASFADLSFQKFKEIISRDDIKVGTEEKVFEAVMRWVKSSECERRDLLPELLRYVRMYFITPDYLIERVSTEEMVRSSLLCRDLVDEAKSYHLLPDKRSKFCHLPSQPRFYEKKTVSAPLSSQPGHKNIGTLFSVLRRSLIYYVYGDTEDGIKVKKFDPEGERWVHVSRYNGTFPHVVVAMGRVIYIFGEHFVHTFELSSKKWSSLHHEKTDLYRSTANVACNGKIYFFGGKSSDKAYCFDPTQKIFLEECQMKRALILPGVASLSSSRGSSRTTKTLIYITGGRSTNAPFPYVYDDVERYNLETKEWSTVPSMFYQRYSHGCCHLENKIYVCGGITHAFVELRSTEMFDPLINQWNIVAPMPETNSSLSVTSHQGKLYVWGSQPSGSMNSHNVKIYDAEKDEWKIGAPIAERYINGRIFLVKS